MSGSSFLYKSPGTLRAPWRLVIFIVAALVAELIATAALGIILRKVFALIGAPAETTGSCIASACAGRSKNTSATCRRMCARRVWQTNSIGGKGARFATDDG